MWFYYENLNIQTKRTSKHTGGDPNTQYWLTEALPTTGNPYFTNTFEKLSGDSSKDAEYMIDRNIHYENKFTDSYMN